MEKHNIRLFLCMNAITRRVFNCNYGDDNIIKLYFFLLFLKKNENLLFHVISKYEALSAFYLPNRTETST